MERWKQCVLRVQGSSEAPGQVYALSSLLLTWSWGQGLTEGANSTPKHVRKAVICVLSQRCKKIQGWHSPKPANTLKWKLEREKKEKESRGIWRGVKKKLWFHAWVGVAYNLKQVLRFITVPRSDPWHIRAQPLKEKKKKKKKRRVSLKPLFSYVIFLYPFGGCVARAFASSKGFLPLFLAWGLLIWKARLIYM